MDYDGRRGRKMFACMRWQPGLVHHASSPIRIAAANDEPKPHETQPQERYLMAQVTPRLYEALQLAFRLHGHDARKSSPVPYLAHVLAVCALVQHDGGDEDEAIA